MGLNVEELKAKVLDLAIRGKLVPQNEAEGTAEDLLIQSEKETQHVSIIKVLSTKPIPSDNIPFDIPDNWKWVWHNKIAEISGGSQPSKSYFSPEKKSGYVQLYQTRDYGKNPQPVYVPEELASKRSVDGEILLARYGGSLGKVFWAKNGAYNVALAKVVLNISPKCIDMKYLFIYYIGSIYQGFTSNANRGAQAGFNKEDMDALLFPLPPLAEQHRIVQKVDELFTLLDKLNSEVKSSTDLLAMLKNKTLDLAIRGKLVLQDESEGTAQDLLKKIKAEKEKLVREKKIKKQEALMPVTEDEIPFELPDNWCWTRIGSLASLVTSGSRGWAKYYSNDGAKFIRMGNLSRNSFTMRLETIQHVCPLLDSEGSRTSLEENDLLVSITGEAGLLGLIPEGFGESYINQHTALIRFPRLLDSKYIPYLFQSSYIQTQLNAPQRGIKNSLRLSDIEELYIPLPPLAEQHRVVKKVDSIMVLIQEMEDDLNRKTVAVMNLIPGEVAESDGSGNK